MPAETAPAPAAATTPAPAAEVKATPAAAPAAAAAKPEVKADAKAKDGLPEPLVKMGEPEAEVKPADAGDFALPEGFDPATGETLKALAGQLGLDGAKSKVLLETYQKAQTAAQEKAEADFVAQAKAYTAQAEEHPVVKELGGVQKARTLAGKALSKFGDAALNDALTASGLAYHPAVLAAFARIGAQLGEGTVTGGQAAPAKSQRDPLLSLYTHPTSASMFKE